MIDVRAGQIWHYDGPEESCILMIHSVNRGAGFTTVEYFVYDHENRLHYLDKFIKGGTMFTNPIEEFQRWREDPSIGFTRVD